MPEFFASLVPAFAQDAWGLLPPLLQYLITVLFKILLVSIVVILIVAFSMNRWTHRSASKYANSSAWSAGIPLAER